MAASLRIEALYSELYIRGSSTFSTLVVLARRL